jgi:hypothetical protein
MEPGPRQTIERVSHPQRGAGIAVYRNGPSFFRPDGGDAIPMKISAGGYCKGFGSYTVLHDPEHGRTEAKKIETDKPSELHRRHWSPIFGMGWYVMTRPTDRFEGDDGRVIVIDACVYAVGTPDYRRRSDKRRSTREPITPEEDQWMTVETRDGTVLAFRREGPPPPADAVKQAEMFR